MKKLLLIIAALMLLNVAVAHADMDWAGYTTVVSGDNYATCGTVWTVFGNGDTGQFPGGQMRIFTQATQSSTADSACDSPWVRPKGWLANHAILWRDFADHVDICKDGGLSHSSKDESEFGLQWTFKHAPCGSGQYFASGQAAVKDNSGNWIVTEWVATLNYSLS